MKLALNVLFAVTLEGKNPYIYLSRPYLCQEHTPVLGFTVFFTISSKKYLKHHDEAKGQMRGI